MPEYSLPDLSGIGSRYGRVTFENGGSVTLRLDLDDLRPSRTHVTNDDVVVLIYRGKNAPASLHGTWTATAKATTSRTAAS